MSGFATLWHPPGSLERRNTSEATSMQENSSQKTEKPVFPPAGKEDSHPRLDIRQDDLSSDATRSLLAYHLRQMHANSPKGSVFALDLSGLQVPSVTVWTAWRGLDIVGVAALNEHDGGTGELKSIRTHPDHLRSGVAAALIDFVITEARARGLSRLSIETGSGPAFEASLFLYRSRGFVGGGTFGAYKKSGFNQFFHLVL